MENVEYIIAWSVISGRLFVHCQYAMGLLLGLVYKFSAVLLWLLKICYQQVY